MTATPEVRTMWRAAGLGGLIAVIEMALIIGLFLLAQPFGPIPRSYAGGAMVMMMAIGSVASMIAAILIGLALGAACFRQPRSKRFMWGWMLLALMVFCSVAGLALRIAFSIDRT
jgi:hypothetical protein